eukprot:TRINITY_DN9072_c0_g1_i6.p1 TRINITY_DN9072_c0_g1~~TRINITY_DN9072_c0_g1_i6.p1  ORF type:complete len:262 (+),score=27.62 TRINITY_DN9072_c0_g1_i6:51-836(+)
MGDTRLLMDISPGRPSAAEITRLAQETKGRILRNNQWMALLLSVVIFCAFPFLYKHTSWFGFHTPTGSAVRLGLDRARIYPPPEAMVQGIQRLNLTEFKQHCETPGSEISGKTGLEDCAKVETYVAFCWFSRVVLLIGWVGHLVNLVQMIGIVCGYSRLYRNWFCRYCCLKSYACPFLVFAFYALGVIAAFFGAVALDLPGSVFGYLGICFYLSLGLLLGLIIIAVYYNYIYKERCRQRYLATLLNEEVPDSRSSSEFSGS